MHHMIRMGVENGIVAETVIASKHYSEGWDLLERNIVVYMYPLMFGNRASTAGTLLLFVAAVLLLLFSLKRVNRLSCRGNPLTTIPPVATIANSKSPKE